jgi:hypothetical protein
METVRERMFVYRDEGGGGDGYSRGKIEKKKKNIRDRGINKTYVHFFVQ